ncbi:hypothetical protein ACS04_28845 [Streptomyces roseus]|uniref:Uncharacterized protein n=1 Tax=Streptomyces roseus TaxID=66430 RepID=A0A0J6XIY1_9ACTN|nr:hypothetical protein ACS04_28845 [Streptomyces roseus]
MSNVSGSGKARASRLAAATGPMTAWPARTRPVDSWMSSVARRGTPCAKGGQQRRISSTAGRISSGWARSASRCSRWVRSRAAPWAMALEVVS